MAPSDYYYLDCGRGNMFGGNSWCEPYKTWWTIYQFDPEDYIKDDSVLGGQVAAWSEVISEGVLHATLWPRAAALADKLWGVKQSTDLKAIVMRLNNLAQKLNQMGISAGAVTDGRCELTGECFDRVMSADDTGLGKITPM